VVRYTIERDGFIDRKIGATVFANACGPCIGNGIEKGLIKEERNTIVHSFNRNFLNVLMETNTLAFVGSPELVTAGNAGDLGFNPLTDTLINGMVKILEAPTGDELPKNGFDAEDKGFQASR
jgi:aconitate hydratase